MRVRGNGGKEAPNLPGTYYRFMLKNPPLNFFAPDPDAALHPDVSAPAPAANISKDREPYVLMHTPKSDAQVPESQVADPKPTTAVVPEPTTAVDDAAPTLTDAPPTPPLAAGSETTPERPESQDEVTGLIERLNLSGAASNSNGGVGGGGAAASGGGATCAHCGIQRVGMTGCARCLQVAYCGKE